MTALVTSPEAPVNTAQKDDARNKTRSDAHRDSNNGGSSIASTA
jgi:hypothetical protein